MGSLLTNNIMSNETKGDFQSLYVKIFWFGTILDISECYHTNLHSAVTQSAFSSLQNSFIKIILEGTRESTLVPVTQMVLYHPKILPPH